MEWVRLPHPEIFPCPFSSHLQLCPAPWHICVDTPGTRGVNRRHDTVCSWEDGCRTEPLWVGKWAWTVLSGILKSWVPEAQGRRGGIQALRGCVPKEKKGYLRGIRAGLHYKPWWHQWVARMENQGSTLLRWGCVVLQVLKEQWLGNGIVRLRNGISRLSEGLILSLPQHILW